ncbi:MAG: UPF0262 family protein [Alphaproteobacteria bacterium]|nr:UPF0262 family protein [Alphaproteobacteria bacterium]
MEMPQARLVDITLDQKSLLKRSPQVEHERKVAILDLLAFNRFALCGEGAHPGPFKLILSLQDNRRLVFEIFDEEDQQLQKINLSLMSFRRIVKDYFVLCESYFDALRTMTTAQIETIDMVRRGMHNEGAEVLVNVLKDRVKVDKQTARRLFTLIAVLHITG